MKELLVKGTQTFLGKEIKVIEGGFGENQRVVLATTVAEIHETRIDKVNELIRNNINRFTNTDLIDLKSKPSEGLQFEHFGFTRMQVSKAKNIYLLSERGYTKLVAMMDNKNEKKWEVMDQLIYEYFAMRKVIKENSLETKVMNELSEMKEEYNFFFEEVKNSYEELSERVDKIMNIQLNTMINIEKLANSFCMIAQAQANTIETKPIEPKQPKREEDTFTISDIAAELGLPNPKKKAAMLNKILAEETVIVCEGKNKFPSPILPKDWYIKAKFTDKTTKEITHYVIWTAKGKEEIIKILKKHLPEQTKMKI